MVALSEVCRSRRDAYNLVIVMQCGAACVRAYEWDRYIVL